MLEITIRRLAGMDEYRAAEQLQQDCWGSGPLDAVPAHLMVTLQHEAGLVLGAFTPKGRLVGFVLGFLGREEERPKHCSHMAAVHPEYQGRGIAYRMKLAQREFMLGAGLDLCTWTYDPLLAANATLNIAKLGAISREYRRDIYGQMNDALNADLPTDRLYVRWEVRTERVRRCAETGQHVEAPVAGLVLNEVKLAGGLPWPASSRALPDEAALGISIPRGFLAVKAADAAAAREWRISTRALFEAAFAAGYTVVNITPDPEQPELLARYTLLREG
ncbi:MAG: GNAT family N-acetyltransferase [Chloroflexia bacterium]